MEDRWKSRGNRGVNSGLEEGWFGGEARWRIVWKKWRGGGRDGKPEVEEIKRKA